MLVPVLPQGLCYGSKKWRWSFQWVDENHCDQLKVRISKILNCWTENCFALTQSSHFSKVSVEEKKAQKVGFFEKDRSLTWFTTTFESLVLMIPFLIMLIYSRSLFATTMFRTSIRDGMKFKIPIDDVLESLYKLRIRESAQLKTVLELYDLEIHQKISKPEYDRLETLVKRVTDQKPITKLWRQKWEDWNRSSGYVAGVNVVLKRTRRMKSMESKKTLFEKR